MVRSKRFVCFRLTRLLPSISCRMRSEGCDIRVLSFECSGEGHWAVRTWKRCECVAHSDWHLSRVMAELLTDNIGNCDLSKID